jgi:hypothetical protein
MDADGSVHCNEASADYATLWSTPANWDFPDMTQTFI